MTTGNKEGSYRVVEIKFPLFMVNPAWENTAVKEKEVKWDALVDIFVEKIDKEWSELQVKFVVTLRELERNKKIAELVTFSIYEVVPGQSMDIKRRLVHMAINHTAGNAIGAWTAKNKNRSIAIIIPPALDRWDAESKEIRTMVKDKWSMWSGK
jgi:hypothetical protein